MQDDSVWPILTEEEMTLLVLIFKMQSEREKKVNLADLEKEAKEAGLGIADHVLSNLNTLIADKGFAIWSDGECPDKEGERVMADSFVELTGCGKMICEILVAGGQESGISFTIPVSIDTIPDEDVGRVLQVAKEILSDPEESDFPLYASNAGRCLRIDIGKSLVIMDILRDAGYVDISPEGIVTMSESQMQMTYPPKK